MTQPSHPDAFDRLGFDDEDSNRSGNPHFQAVLDARLSRRSVLRGSVGSAAAALFGGLPLAGCGGDDGDGGTVGSLEFRAVSKNLNDTVTVPEGYTARPIYALGDPLSSSVPAYRNDGTDTQYEMRAGDHHDGMEWFGLAADGKPSTTASERGLLAMNHEATTDETRSSFFLHADGGTTTLPRPVSEVDKELMIHGVSVVEVTRGSSGAWSTV